MHSALSAALGFLAVPTLWTANDPFVGKWKLDVPRSTIVDQMRVKVVGSNIYRFNFEGGPAETVRADGTEQPGTPGTTLSVKAPDARTLMVVRKQDGRKIVSATWKLSRDGNRLRDAFTSLQADGSSTTVHYLYRRRSGKSGFAGVWESTTKPIGLQLELEIEPDESGGLAFVTPGSRKSVLFDGRDHRLPDAEVGLTVSGRRLGRLAMDYIEKKNGRAVRARHFSLSGHRRTLTETLRTTGQHTPAILVFSRE